MDTQKEFVRPRVDVVENASEYLIVADVPGAKADTLDIHFQDGELTFEAKRPAVEGRSALAEEYREVDFHRAFTLPEGVDAEKIEAHLANGVLKVKLPKTASKQARKIAVRAS